LNWLKETDFGIPFSSTTVPLQQENQQIKVKLAQIEQLLLNTK